MIKAPIGGPDFLQMQNISPAVQKAQPDNGNDFRDAFENAKETVSKVDGSTKVNRTEGTGAGGKDSGAADQTANDSKLKQNNDKAVSADKREKVSDDTSVKESVKADDTAKAAAAEQTGAADEAVYDTAEISKIAEKLILDIASLLGITAEELGGFLEDMGIKTADLLIPENINILVADVKGGGDMISLAADADLMELAASINEAVTKVSEQITELTQDIPTETVAEVFDESLERCVSVAETTASAVNDNNENIKNDANTVMEVTAENEVTVNAGDLTIERITDTGDNGSRDTSAEDEGTQSSSDRRSFREINEYREDVSFSRTEMTADMEIRPEDVMKADQSLGEYGTNTAEVVDQIMEHMKAQVKVDMGSLEMVLHPASLGNVAVNIANNSGNLTAQFTVQNEAVKEAIEAQLVVFKENLEQQGVKVEAVEVSVASHGFEENLEQGNDQNDAEDAERERLRKATRNIDLGPFGEEGVEDLDEAEAVTVDMMRSDGNRMNYRV